MGFWLITTQKSLFRKNQNKSCLYQGRFLKWFLMKSLRLIYLMIFAYFMPGIMDRPDRNLIFFLGKIEKYEGLVRFVEGKYGIMSGTN